MPLFVWTSSYLKAYGPGTIAVAAQDVAQARAAAQDALFADIRERFDYLYLGLSAHEILSDPDIAEKRALIRQDLAGEPEIAANGVLLVRGSE